MSSGLLCSWIVRWNSACGSASFSRSEVMSCDSPLVLDMASSSFLVSCSLGYVHGVISDMPARHLRASAQWNGGMRDRVGRW